MDENATKLDRLPVVAIVGRPNVGKSSLFNAILGRRFAIVHEMSGVTRDRVMTTAVHENRRFTLIDTGGLGMLDGQTRQIDMWDREISRQVDAAIESADLLVFVGDAMAGVTPLDEDIANRLRASGKKVVMAVNKCDGDKFKNDAAEFSRLGFGNPFPICCLHREGVKSLVSYAMLRLPEKYFSNGEENVRRVRIAVVGRPNVGKSSIINALIGNERVMTSPVAGTTRDSVDVEFTLHGDGVDYPALLVDTAGIRKTSKIDGVVEYFSVMRSRSAIDRADVVLMVVEASDGGVTAQDRRIANIIESARKACVIAVNKTDLVRKSEREMEKSLREELPNIAYAPSVFVSALNRTKLGLLSSQICEVASKLDTEITTGVLNRVIGDAIETHTPPLVGPAALKVFYASLVGKRPPKVLLFVNRPSLAADNYIAFLSRRLRAAFDLVGVPLDIELRARPKKITSIRTRENANKRSRRRDTGGRNRRY